MDRAAHLTAAVYCSFIGDLMNIKYPPTSSHQSKTDSYSVFSSLRLMERNMKSLHRIFAFFQRNYLPEGRLNKTSVAVKELSCWKSGAIDGVPPFHL